MRAQLPTCERDDVPPVRARIALVLAAGGARGAYEAGVVRFLREGLAPRLGRQVPFDILAGTSIGSVTACFLAATATMPEVQAERLVEAWESLDVRETLRIDLAGIASMLWGQGRGGALLDSSSLRNLVRQQIPWPGIGESLRQGALEALAVSATHLRSGGSVTFVERRPELSLAEGDYTTILRDAHITAEHALASAAIPFVLPPVVIDGAPFCDGGLRQLTPLGPALRLGASVVVVVSLGRPPEAGQGAEGGVDLAANLLGMFLHDHVDSDLARLRRINQLVAKQSARSADPIEERLLLALSVLQGKPYRRVTDILVAPSRDPGAVALDHARRPEFRRRARGTMGRILLALAERGAEACGLLSCLLFDGAYARSLIELGYADAAAREADLGRAFDLALAGRESARRLGRHSS